MLTVIGVGMGDFDGVWFEASAEGYDPTLPYECVGVLMDPKDAK